VILPDGQQEAQREAQIAIVCVPDIDSNKADFTRHLMHRILNPICHALATICYLIIAIVYFVMPQLRDLVGNILTSISLCLITSQAADLVRIFTEFTSHVSFLVAGVFFKPAAIFYFVMSVKYFLHNMIQQSFIFTDFFICY
jgi:G protein-coupled receptor Mth (Methuselah protein)